MKTNWLDLVMINYEVEKTWVEQFIPQGCELDLYNGKAYVSVVAFLFRNTSILGIPMPFYRSFPEINLRIYVKDKLKNRRGVVFIKEIIPHRLPTIIANTVFRENFFVLPMNHKKTEKAITYTWGDTNKVQGDFSSDLTDWKVDSEEGFITDNFWAFKQLKRKTIAFKIEHRPWRIRTLKNTTIQIDIETLYGKEWAAAISDKPSSVFYLDGSEVGVSLPSAA